MRRWLRGAFVVGWLVLPAGVATAQPPPLLPSTPLVIPDSRPLQLSFDQAAELARWIDAMVKWQHAEKRWPNQPAHDAYGRIVRRQPRPEAPSWLEPTCAAHDEAALASTPALAQACRLLAGLAADPQAEVIQQQTQTARADKEKLIKGSFLSRVHLDGLWSTTSSDVRFYGLVGSHISLVDVGRVQFFGPPGVLLLSMPNGKGSREIRVGYTWGMSVRLADITLFGAHKNATLFLSVAKCWTVGSNLDRLGTGGFDIAGLSIAPRNKHRQ
ncbi:MAG: hypothetical protein HOQ29_00800 [Acidobacteria bacterium]|nr:hypothetical protein [Acidobacteriota bacterium]